MNDNIKQSAWAGSSLLLFGIFMALCVVGGIAHDVVTPRFKVDTEVFVEWTWGIAGMLMLVSYLTATVALFRPGPKKGVLIIFGGYTLLMGLGLLANAT